ncbi:MAG: ABC transporter permease [Actinomycetota bacterium]|nr:ABC transporter permease [Actinomycetota bacterium]
MTATATTAPARSTGPAAHRGASFPVATLTVAGRTIKKFVRTPQLIVAGTLSGVMFLIIFRYVFGGAISHTGAMTYVNFVVPGFVMTSVLFTGMGSAAGIAEDLTEGLFDRLRSLPVPPLSIICGRALADTAMVTWSLAITTAFGFAVGFRIHDGVGSALVAFGLCVLFGFAFCWLFIALGFLAGSAQAAQSLSFLVFPLTFVSSAYVPVATMPTWMRAFADHQPITVMSDTVRILAEGQPAVAVIGHPLGTYLPQALAWSAVLLAVFVPLAVWRLGRS